MNALIITLQDAKIEEKLKKAPDTYYRIGVFIGSILPFVILVALAFVIYK